MAVPAGVDHAGSCVELSYVDAVHGRRRRPLRDCVTSRFEDVDPVRAFRWSRGERHFPGWYWAATTGRHVGFESWLERDQLLLMDFDPNVVGIGSQPLWLHWHDGVRERRHAPDCFVRRADGSAVVVDVRADERIEPQDAEAFEMTRLHCALAGWRFERLGTPDAVLLANVRWLSRYRQTRCLHDPAVARLREAFAIPRPLMVWVNAAGDRLSTLPVLFHLLWLQRACSAAASENSCSRRRNTVEPPPPLLPLLSPPPGPTPSSPTQR